MDVRRNQRYSENLVIKNWFDEYYQGENENVQIGEVGKSLRPTIRTNENAAPVLDGLM